MTQPHDANQPGDGRLAGGAPAARGKQGPNQPPAILNTAPTPATLLRCLQRRLVLAVFLGLALGGVAAGGAWVFAPEAKHSVRTLVRLPAPKDRWVPTRDGQVDVSNHQRTQAALAKSRIVLASALADPAVGKLARIKEMVEPLDWLEREVQVDFSVAPEIMKISMRGLDTEDLKVLVNSIRGAYLREIIDKERNKRVGMKQALVELIASYEAKLKSHREQQRGIEALVGAKNSTARALRMSYEQQLLSAAQKDLVNTKSALSRARLDLSGLITQEKLGKPAPVPDADVLDALSRHKEVADLKSEVERLEKLKADWERRSAKGKKDPQYLQADQALARVKKDMAERTDHIKKAVVKSLEEVARANARTARGHLEQEVAKYEALQKQLEADVKEQMTRLVDMTNQGALLDRDKDEVAPFENTLAVLRAENEALGIQLQAPSMVEVLEEATVARVDATTRRALVAGGAGVGLFAFCLLGLAWLEYRARKVASVDDVVLGLGMRLVGTMPTSRRGKVRGGSGGRVPSVSQQVLTESIDAARTTLLHLARSHSLRTVMVTSAVAGEGKTSLSCHLAASLARGGLRVLLIDADMRNPSAHRLFGMTCEAGFSEVLCGAAGAADCIKETSLRNLWLLPAGCWTDETAASLNQGQAAALFEQLREQFDIIVIDSSPVLPVADALLIGQQVDGVVLSVLCQVSRLNNLYAAWQRVQEHGGQPLGVVINGVSGGTYGASYAYPYPRRPKVKA